MSRYHSYLNTAIRLLSLYKGEQPFASFSKVFFAADKKYGSGDRKMISQLCYQYFRTVHLLKDLSAEEAIIKANFLCSRQPAAFLDQMDPSLNLAVTESPEKKLGILGLEGQGATIFPLSAELGSGIDAASFGLSHLVQPDLFVRVRPGQHEQVKRKLDQAGCTYRFLDHDCIAFPNGTRLEEVLDLDREAVIQDASSQEVGALMREVEWQATRPIQVWDVCAASGGKSILAADIFRSLEILVSDVRESILANLAKRFRIAGIGKYQSQLADVSAADFRMKRNVDLVIADVPCSGSGTWGRTPEQLLCFRKETINDYAALQQQIVSHAARPLRPGGHFLYITCSVFRKENEDVLDFLQKELRLDLVKAQYIKGYTRRADTMFAALLRKPLEAD